MVTPTHTPMPTLELPYTAHIAQVQALWAQYPKPIQEDHPCSTLELWIKRGWAIPESFHPGGLLFVGISPAFSDDFNDGVFQFSVGEKMHPYYNAFENVLQGPNKRALYDHWQPMDLLFLRETHQSEIKAVIGPKETTRFIFEQLKISVGILEAIRPRIIVVANTLARRFLGFDMNRRRATENRHEIWMGYSFKFDEGLGTHVIHGRVGQKGEPLETALKGTPVFFTSMLSGQRALDKGSRDRLVWHIRQVWNKSQP